MLNINFFPRSFLLVNCSLVFVTRGFSSNSGFSEAHHLAKSLDILPGNSGQWRYAFTAVTFCHLKHVVRKCWPFSPSR